MGWFNDLLTSIGDAFKPDDVENDSSSSSNTFSNPNKPTKISDFGNFEAKLYRFDGSTSLYGSGNSGYYCHGCKRNFATRQDFDLHSCHY